MQVSIFRHAESLPFQVCLSGTRYLCNIGTFSLEITLSFFANTQVVNHHLPTPILSEPPTEAKHFETYYKTKSLLAAFAFGRIWNTGCPGGRVGTSLAALGVFDLLGL